MNETSQLLTYTDSLLTVVDRPPVVMVRGSGMYLWDTEGKRYLDFLNGWAVNALGHSPQIISAALQEQSQLLVNASPSFYNKPMLEFAQLLTSTSCLDRVFFCSTGAEANESAIKLARKYGTVKKNGAYEIISTEHSFHGRTLATMAATGKDAWKTLFEPKPGGFIHVPFNDFRAVEEAVSERTAGIIVEPIQGEGGVNIADRAYLNDLRSLCDETGVLLILDEIQTGVGRTGTMFCYEQYQIEPDIMTLGKGIGGGFPLAAMLCTEELNIFEKGEQGGTYTGQPLAMAVGLAVVRHIVETRLYENAKEMGIEIKDVLQRLSRDFPMEDIRGEGLLIAFDTAEAIAETIRDDCFRSGLIVNAPGASTIRLVPPLIVERHHIEEMSELLGASLDRVLSGDTG